MAWSELLGSRRILDENPNYVDYVVTFTGAQADTLKAGGKLYSDWTDSTTNKPDTTGPGGISLDGEPVQVQISAQQNATPTKQHVTVRFRGHYIR